MMFLEKIVFVNEICPLQNKAPKLIRKVDIEICA